MNIFSIKWTINRQICNIPLWKRCLSDLSTINYGLKEVIGQNQISEDLFCYSFSLNLVYFLILMVC
jgi:hypothetical protein